MYFSTIALPLLLVAYLVFATLTLWELTHAKTFPRSMWYVRIGTAIVALVTAIVILNIIDKAASVLNTRPDMRTRFRFVSSMYVVITVLLAALLAITSIDKVRKQILGKMPDWARWVVILLPLPVLLILVARALRRFVVAPRSVGGGYASVPAAESAGYGDDSISMFDEGDSQLTDAGVDSADDIW